MDYVVAGFGIGAILALIGFALWELFGTVEEPGKNWLSRAAIGLMLGALVIWAVTGVSLISHIEDSMGSRLVLMTSLVTLVSIAAGAFWYWRADRSLILNEPRQATASPQREVAATLDPITHEEMELTEWDDWPERDSSNQAPSADETEATEPTASFAPEVAVETAEASENEVALAEAEIANFAATESEPTTLEAVEPAPEPAEPALALPANVRPFRTPAQVEPPDPAVGDDVLIAETIEVAVVPTRIEAPDDFVVEGKSEIEPDNEREAGVPAESDAPEAAPTDQPQPSQESEPEPGGASGSAAPVGFESSLLADVDGSLAGEDGGYRSPLLSDLGSDKLDGVGLAKWRSNARLTDTDENDEPPGVKRERRV